MGSEEASTSNLEAQTSTQLLEAAAQRNEVLDSQWPEIRNAIETKVEEHIASFRSDEAAMFDKAADPPWPMDDEAIQRFTNRLRSLLLQFKSESPFTIQRLAELALSPQPHYTSLPKYLRAIERCLLVSSPSAAFPILHASNKDATLPDGRPARSRSSSISSTPLLSPIPFLVNRANEAPGSPRVDELDLGEGTAEMVEAPVALSSTSAGDGVKSPPPVTDAPEAVVEAEKAAAKMEVDQSLVSKAET